MPQSYAALYIHFVFSTKDRAALIEPAWKDQLYAFIGGICENRGCLLLIGGGMPDHVHLLVSQSRECSVSDFMRDIKAGSSKWVRESVGKNAFEWQTGYSAFAVSFSNLETVRKYIEQQEEHHKKFDFKEEFLALLKKHQVSFDERYIWK